MAITSLASVGRGPAFTSTGDPIPTVTVVAAPYAATGPIISGTSQTPNSIDTVTNKTFLINERNRSFFPGTRVRATATGYSNVWLEGVVVTWDGQNVTIDGDLSAGTGVYSDWQINVAGQPGMQGATGPMGPVGPSGGPIGPQGVPGTPGSVWRNGTGVPPNSLGVDGDYYLNDATGNVYQRVSTAYSVVANILGPAGSTGPAGPQGPVGSAWRAGAGAPANTLGADGDFYLNDTTDDVYQRQSGTYVVVANIGGAPGAAGPGYKATSTTSLAVATGSQAFTTQAGLAYSAGARARATSAGAPTAWMEGNVTAYSGTLLTINVDAVNGTGTHADWNINVSGLQGATGPQGPSGAGTGNVLSSGTPVNGQIAQWTGSSTIQGINAPWAPLASPVFTGDPQAPTAAAGDNDNSIATTAFVTASFAPIASPIFTGTPRAPTQATADNTTNIATTAFVKAQGPYQPLDADLTAIAALTGTNVIYYRSAADTWSAVTIGANMTFAGGVLNSAAGGASLTISDTVPASPTNGQLWWESDTGILWLYYTDPNTSQWIAVGGGAGPAPATTPSGVVQHAYAENTTYTTISTNMAGAIDTIPQQTDGTQILTATITPKSVSNKLRFDVVIPCDSNSAFTAWAAVFQDSTAAAIAATMWAFSATDQMLTVPLSFEIAVSSLATTTFKVRAAMFAAGANLYVNGASGGRRMGGSMRATLNVTELAS
jgi:hypothetical protein